MKHRINFFWSRNFIWLALMFAAAAPVTAAPVVQTNDTPVVPRSVFVQPANPAEGRDPFFPAHCDRMLRP